MFDIGDHVLTPAGDLGIVQSYGRGGYTKVLQIRIEERLNSADIVLPKIEWHTDTDCKPTLPAIDVLGEEYFV